MSSAAESANVLTVLDDILSTSTGMLADECAALREARAAIAELVTAAEAYRVAVFGRVSTNAAFDAGQRLDAALMRVGAV
jgi:hypothetical protein